MAAFWLSLHAGLGTGPAAAPLEAPGSAERPTATPPLPEGLPADPRGSESATRLPPDTALISVEARPDTRLEIAGQDFGSRRTFRFRPLEPGRWYRYDLTARFSPEKSEHRQLLLRGGRLTRLVLTAPDVRRPEVVLETGHTRQVRAAAFHPDGSTVATASEDMTVILWEAATGRPLRTLQGHHDFVSAVAFSPDGQRMLTGSWDQAAVLWETATGRRLGTFRGHAGHVTSVAFSPDGRWVLTGSWDQTAVLWEASTGRQVQSYAGHEAPIAAVAFNPDGRTLVTASWDRTAVIWEAATAHPLHTLRGHAAALTAAAFSPDGTTLATASEDGTALLWDAATGREQPALCGHAGAVTDVGFSPDSRTVVTAGRDQQVRLWERATGRPVRVLRGQSGPVTSAVFSPDGQSLLTCSWPRAVTLWKAATGAPLRTFQGHSSFVTALALAPDGHRLLTGAWDGSTVLWDGAAGRPLSVLANAEAVTCVVFSPDGRQALTASRDRTAALWDCAPGERRHVLGPQAGWVGAAAFSPDGRTIVTGAQDGSARLWDAVNGQPLQSLTGHRGPIAAAAFSPDGQTVLTGSWDGTAILWEAATGRPRQTLREHSDSVTAAAFSPDGRTVLTGSQDGTAKLWDAATGRPVHTLGRHGAGVVAVAFGPEGDLILTGSRDKTAILWESATGQPLRTFEGHSGAVTSLTFGLAGWAVLTGSEDGTVRLWDVAGGDELARLVPLDRGRNWVAVTAAGLFDGSAEGRNIVGFREGTGLKTVPLDRFFQDFYCCGLWARVWGGDRPRPAQELPAKPAPLVHLLQHQDPGPAGAPDRIAIDVTVTDQGGGIRGPWLRHNNALVRLDGTVRREGKVVHQRFLVPLVRGDNRIEAWAASADGSWESERAVCHLPFDGRLPEPELHVLAIGINEYAAGAGFSGLRFSVADAEAIADMFRRRASGLYHRVYVTKLLDARATRTSILDAVRTIAGRARPQDTLVVYASGHGKVVGQRYYLIPHDFRPSARPDTPPDAAEPADDFHARALAVDELGDVLAEVRALKRVLIFDTCYSGGAGVLAERQPAAFAFREAVERFHRSQGVFTLAASGPKEWALEHPQLRHSILAYTLLAGVGAARGGPLDGQALSGSDGAGHVDVLAWFRFARQQAPRLYQDLASRSQQIILTGEDQPSFPLLEVGP